MVEKKLIKKYFKILEKNGYKFKFDQFNYEYCVSYIKKNLIIEINFNTSDNNVWLALDENGNRLNIFDSNFFKKEDLLCLQMKCNYLSKLNDLNQLFVCYSNFITNNINMLL